MTHTAQVEAFSFFRFPHFSPPAPPADRFASAKSLSFRSLRRLFSGASQDPFLAFSPLDTPPRRDRVFRNSFPNRRFGGSPIDTALPLDSRLTSPAKTVISPQRQLDAVALASEPQRGGGGRRSDSTDRHRLAGLVVNWRGFGMNLRNTSRPGTNAIAQPVRPGVPATDVR
jgi:hypothetical protein